MCVQVHVHFVYVCVCAYVCRDQRSASYFPQEPPISEIRSLVDLGITK